MVEISGVETRWWNLSAVAVASVLGCGTAEIGADGGESGSGGVTECVADSDCEYWEACVQGVCGYQPYCSDGCCEECEYLECYDDLDCAAGNLCKEEGGEPACVPAEPLPECPEELGLALVPLALPAGEHDEDYIHSLSFVDGDGAGQDLIIGRGATTERIRAGDEVVRDVFPKPAYSVDGAVGGDLDADGRADLVLSHGGALISVWLATDDPEPAPEFIDLAGGPGSLLLGHFDGDEHLDIAYSAGHHGVHVVSGDGMGSFMGSSELDVPWVGDALLPGRFPDDGFAMAATTSVYLFRGAAGLSELVLDRVDDEGYVPFVGSFGGGPGSDVVAWSTVGDWTLGTVFRNGTSSTIHRKLPEGRPVMTTAADLTADGFDEAVLVMEGGELVIIRGWGAEEGRGVLRCATTLPGPDDMRHLAVGDLDGDGHDELAYVSDTDPTELVLLSAE